MKANRRRMHFPVTCLLALTILITGCAAGGGGSSSPPTSNPVPGITAISPNSATAGAAAQTLTINGTNFLSSSTVTYNGVAHTATFVSSTQLTISSSASDQATAGSYAVVVTNPSPGGGTSNSAQFVVNPANNPVPTITGLSPSSATAGAAAQTLTINGTNFLSSSTVTYNGVAHTATFVSSTQLTISSSASDQATAGSYAVVVTNPSPGGASNSVNFIVNSAVNNPVPTITSLSPSSATAGAAAQTLTINGTNFLSSSTVTYNSIAHSATFLSSTQLTILLTASDQATAGSYAVVVTNPSPGGASNPVNFTVNNTTGTAGFVLTGSLNTARTDHTATLLNNGMVLLAGGYTVDTDVAGAELYNPATGTFTLTGSMTTSRVYHTATLLNNGMVLIAGGYNEDGEVASAELYNPATGTFTLTGSLNTARYSHTATLLNNGMVLIAGGQYDSSGDVTTSAELYNPATGTFTLTGSLNTSPVYDTATLLNNGMVLIAGGLYDSTFDFTASAELYNPATGTFTPTGSLNTARAYHTATLLNNGMALIAGGAGDSNFDITAELYNPATGAFTLTGSLTTARYGHTATLLNDGTVLIAGGADDSNGDLTASAELYNPATGTFTLTGSMTTARVVHTATLLNDGMVLMAGGADDSNGDLTASAELFEPAALTPSGLVSISLAPSSPTVPLGTVQRFTATGTFSNNSTEQLASLTWSSSNAGVMTLSDDASNAGAGFAVGAGSATVSACAGAVCGSTIVSVPVATLMSIAVTPANPSINLDSTQQFTATATYGDGGTEDLTATATWSSSATGVATISNTSGSQGLATTTGVGTTMIEAASGAMSGSTTLTVAPIAPDLSITKTHTGSFTAGTNGTFIIEVVNDGNGATTAAIVVTDVLSSSFTFVSGTVGSWTCGAVGQLVRCTSNVPIAPGASAPNINLTVSISASASGNISNTAMVATSGDNNATNNSSTDTVTIGSSCVTSGSEPMLLGNYAFYLQGFQGSGAGSPFDQMGSFTSDGAGNITGGQEDTNSTTGHQLLTIQSSGSSYSVGSDKRGCMTLAFSSGGMETFRFTLADPNAGISSKGRIIEFDDSSGTGAGTRGSGAIIRQDVTAFSTTTFQPRYAFGMDGFDPTGGHVAMGGSFSYSTVTGNISSGYFDSDDGGTLFSLLGTANGTIGSVTSTTGRATASFNAGADHTYNWAVYVVNANQFFIISTDALGNNTPLLIGRAIVTGSSFSNSSISGSDVIHATAFDNLSGQTIVTLGVVSLSNADLSGTIYNSSSASGLQTGSLSGETYSVDAVSGRVTLSNAGANPFIFYVTMPSGTPDGIAAFIVGTDSAATFGVSEVQPTATYSNSSVSGDYFLGTEDPGDNTATNVIAVGALTAGVGTLARDFSGVAGLFINSPLQFCFTINSDGTGTGSQGGAAGTCAGSATSFTVVTNGTKVFLFSISSGSPAFIRVMEK